MISENILKDKKSMLSGLEKWAQTDLIATVNNGYYMSFKELAVRSDAIAAYLLENNPGQKPVAIWCDKELNSLCAIFGCLKSGHPYTIIASFFPQHKIEAILAVCQPCLVFATSPVRFPVDGYLIIKNAQIDALIQDYYLTTVDYVVNPHDTAAILFTSGSTGAPKGVQISIANISYWADSWTRSDLPVAGGYRVLDVFNYSFVASFVNIYYCMAVKGATLYAVDRQMSLNFDVLIDTIIETNPHILAVTPNLLDLLLHDSRFTEDKMNALIFMNLGGESVSPGIARTFLDRFSILCCRNSYGSTETTCAGVLATDITRELLDRYDRVPVGVPSKYMSVDVVDEDGNCLPDGEIGELIIRGPLITKGYYRNQESTAQFFFTHADGSRAFRTSDLVMRRDGLIFYMGRKDNLVKVGGYRVELEEVEFNLRQIEIIRSCAVVPVMQEGRTVMLAAYIVLKNNNLSKLKAMALIKEKISQKIPAYMIPQKIVIMDELPCNANSKTDRKKLLEMSILKY